jgi:2-amino-4-hydroxy-6-hydroxymethyldihydropteridine diphosphokinase
VGEGSCVVRPGTSVVRRPSSVVDGWRYAVGVGSNRGEREWTIAEAERLLAESSLARVIGRSSLVTTQPVGGPLGQGAFLNAAWIVESGLGPHQLLALLQRIETALGRTREIRWGARTLDRDLLLRADGLVVATPVLSLPHPRLRERRFVLAPLAEVAPDWLITPSLTVHAALATTTDDGRRTTDDPLPSVPVR